MPNAKRKEDCGLSQAKADALRAKAIKQYQDEGRIEIDNNAPLSRASYADEPDGCYVQAWVWVYYKD